MTDNTWRNLTRPIKGCTYENKWGHRIAGTIVRATAKAVVFSPDGVTKRGKPVERVIPAGKCWRLTIPDDGLVAAFTGGDTMQALLGPVGINYRPTIHLSQTALHPRLASRIDWALAARGEDRRAYRAA